MKHEFLQSITALSDSSSNEWHDFPRKNVNTWAPNANSSQPAIKVFEN